MSSRASKEPITCEQYTPEEIRQAATMLNKLGASKGGQARAAALSPRKRKMIARKAAMTRWAKQETA